LPAKEEQYCQAITLQYDQPTSASLSPFYITITTSSIKQNVSKQQYNCTENEPYNDK